MSNPRGYNQWTYGGAKKSAGRIKTGGVGTGGSRKATADAIRSARVELVSSGYRPTPRSTAAMLKNPVMFGFGKDGERGSTSRVAAARTLQVSRNLAKIHHAEATAAHKAQQTAGGGGSGTPISLAAKPVQGNVKARMKAAQASGHASGHVGGSGNGKGSRMHGDTGKTRDEVAAGLKAFFNERRARTGTSRPQQR